MNLFILDTRDRDSNYRGGLVCVVGSSNPTVEEKKACIEVVARYAMDGWAIAADPHTLIGRLAARTACAARAKFVPLARVPGADMAAASSTFTAPRLASRTRLGTTDGLR
jgi:hypothetical protein